MKKISVLITATVLDEVTVSRFKEHAKSAVAAWGGQYHPDDPLFSAHIKKVSVMPISQDVKVSLLTKKEKRK